MGNVGRAAAALALACAGCGHSQTGGQDTSAPKAQAAQVVAQTFPVAGYQLSAIERDGTCYVGFEGNGKRGELRTALKPYCRFVQTPDGSKPAQFTYADIGGATVLIVVGSPADPGKAAPASPESYCGTGSQGIVLRREGVTLSTRVGRGRKCAAGQDEKEFWLFSH